MDGVFFCRNEKHTRENADHSILSTHTGEVWVVHTGFFVVIHQFALFSLHPLSSNIPSSHYDAQPIFCRLFSPCFLFPIIYSQENAADRQTCIRTEELHWDFKSLHITLLCEQSEGEPVTVSILTSMSICWCLQCNFALQEGGEGC